MTTGLPPETFLVPAASAAASPDPLDEVAAAAPVPAEVAAEAAPVPAWLPPALLEPLFEQPAISRMPAIAGTATARTGRARPVDLWGDRIVDRTGLSFECVESGANDRAALRFGGMGRAWRSGR